MFHERMRKGSAAGTALVLLVGALATGCSFGEVYLNDPFLREVALTETQLRYTNLVRWSAFHKAAKFVESDAREKFLALADPLENFRFTDFESEPVDIDDETGEAHIRVTYKGYSLRSPFEVKVIEKQHWRRHGGNDWRVSSEFEGLEGPSGLAKAD